MEEISFRGKLVRVLIAFIIVTISLLPTIMRGINSDESVATKVFGILLLFGWLILRWWILGAFLFVLFLLSNCMFKAFCYGVGKTEPTSKYVTEAILGSAIVASFIIVIVLQFCAAWGLGIPFIPNLVNFYFHTV